MSTELVMPSNHLIFCHPLLLPPLIFPSIRVFPTSQFFTSGEVSSSHQFIGPLFFPKYFAFFMQNYPSSILKTWEMNSNQEVSYVKWIESVSRSVMSDSLRGHGLEPIRFLCPWNFPGKNTGVSCHFLLQRIFPTQGWKLGLPHCKQILYSLNNQGR